jgi:2-methylcitrate dehydratase PrpD
MPGHTDLLPEFAEALLHPGGSRHASHAALLLADHLFCVRDGAARGPVPGDEDSAAGKAGQSCARDRDDIDWLRLIHSGSVVWPIVMVEGRLGRITGSTALNAAVAGYEAGARVAEILGPEHRRRFHPTATAGLVAAAVTASVVRGSTIEQVATAMGHALSVMGGSIGAIRERSGTRQFHRSHAVRSGIAAAEAAHEGVYATRRDLVEGGGIIEPLDERLGPLLTRRGNDAIADASLRIHPTSGWNQCAFEAATLAAADVREPFTVVAVEVPPEMITISESGEGSVDERWVSLRWAVSRGALGPTAPDDEVRRVAAIVELRPRVDPGAFVEISSRSSVRSAEVVNPLGHPDRPVAAAALAAKWDLDEADMAGLVAGIEEAWAVEKDAVPAIDRVFKRATSA